MRREGYIIEKIISDSNLSEAFDKVLRGKKRKRSPEGRYLLANRDKVLANIKQEISDGTFRVAKYWERQVFEGGKWRTIQITTMERRIGVFAIMAVVDDSLRRRFIRTSGASIRGRGTHDLHDCIKRDMYADPDGMRYCYMFDIHHFYDNIKPDFVMYCLGRVFKDKKLLGIMDGLLRMIPEGISKGLRSSQGMSNLLLSTFVDHFLKDRYGIKYYYRYCDDGRIYHHSKKVLWEIRNMINDSLAGIDLTIKDNECVFPNELGVDYLGYVTYTYRHVRMRKRVKQDFARALHKVKSRRRRQELIASLYGIAKHACCHNLFYKLTGKRMKDFKELGVFYRPVNKKTGKPQKIFPGMQKSITELVNIPIEVYDCDLDGSTEYGDDRCWVAFRVDGVEAKFVTSSKVIKDVLQQLKEMPDSFPFRTTIKSMQYAPGKFRYFFT